MTFYRTNGQFGPFFGPPFPGGKGGGRVIKKRKDVYSSQNLHIVLVVIART